MRFMPFQIEFWLFFLMSAYFYGLLSSLSKCELSVYSMITKHLPILLLPRSLFSRDLGPDELLS